MKAILLNGPPRSGKDTIGSALSQLTGAAGCMKFSEPIRTFMQLTFGIDMDIVAKDLPHTELHGRTPRQVAIQYSESFIKPLFGIEFFGRALARRMKAMIDQTSHVYVTDSGFPGEARALGAAIGYENVLQVILDRPGCTFAHDSRSYWNVLDIGHVDFTNDCATLIDLQHKLVSDLVPEIQKWLAK